MRSKFYLLGLFAGDGWFQTRGIAIGTNSDKFAKKIAKVAKSLYGVAKIKKRTYSDGHKMNLIFVWKKEVQDDFAKLLSSTKQKSKTFKPPKMSASESREFVAGLFDAEASAYKWYGKPRVGLGIYNRTAAEFIVKTLRSDSIKAYLSACKNGEYRIDITGNENVERLFKNYSFLRLVFPKMGKSTL
ncbi:TPA: hypothetical protein H1009_00115 [archaeon]|nr:hypothetical protein [Candidatus Naiadarchaeales archaeon SRR2090153.bin461]